MHIQEKMGDSNTEARETLRLTEELADDMEPGALRRRLDDIYLRRREHVSPNLPETQPGREAHLLLFPTEHYGVTFKGVSPPTRSALMERLHWK